MGATAGTRKLAPLSIQDDFYFFDGKPYPLGVEVNVRILPDQLIWTQSGIGPIEAFSGLTAARSKKRLVSCHNDFGGKLSDDQFPTKSRPG